MKKRMRSILVSLLIVAMVFTMTNASIFADDVLGTGDMTVAENVVEDAATAPAAEAVQTEADDLAAEEPVVAVPEQANDETANLQSETANEKTQSATDRAPVRLTVKSAAKNTADASADLDAVKEMISKLPNSSDVTEADREAILKAQAAYEALSKEDQAVIDGYSGANAYNTSQPYGRILESALWGLWSLEKTDNTTTLAPGTYDASTTPALASSYSKGKSISSRQKPWSVRSITVDENHKVTALLTVESDTYSGVVYQGKTYPKTNTSGNSTFEIPVELNTTFYFSGVSETMPVPIAFAVTTSIDTSAPAPMVKDADYKDVDAAIDKAKAVERDKYTEESLKTMDDAVAAVERGKTSDEQDAVDAMAKAINDAVAGLQEKPQDDPKPQGPARTELSITNNTGMFRAVSAYLISEDGQEYLVMALSGSGYKELYKGDYEHAVKNGDGSADRGNGTWVHGTVNEDGKLEFRIPVSRSDTKIPCVAVSNTYYEKYLNGENELARALYPRQIVLDRKAMAIVTDDYNDIATFDVVSKVGDFKTEATAEVAVTGGPNSNNYTVAPALVMKDDTYTRVTYSTVAGGRLSTVSDTLQDGKFAISLQNAPNIEVFKDKTPIEMSFRVSKNAPYEEAGTDVVRQVTIDKMAGTIEITGTPLTPKKEEPEPEPQPDPQEEPGEAIDLKITNTTGMFKAEKARLVTEKGQQYLVVALSGAGYHELYKGTYEQAVANGDGSAAKGNGKWVHGKTNASGKWEFKIPVSQDETYIPCVAISNTYYNNYLNGQNPLPRAFYPRQMVLDRKAGTLTTGEYDETVDFAVTSKVADFKVAKTASTRVVGGPNSNNYNVAPTLVMADGTYDQVTYWTVADGEMKMVTAPIKEGAFAISLLNAPNVWSFEDKQPIEMTFRVAKNAPYAEAGTDVLRTVTIDKMAKTITIDGTPLSEKGSTPAKPATPVTPGKPSGKPTPAKPGSSSKTDQKEYKDKTDGYTAAVNASTTLKDGEYTPDSFSWSGGTNRVSISCPKITVRNGQAYATIVFTSPKFDQLRANGSTYYKQGGGNSTFVIPVNLNANNTIIGRTTAMSQPHWIEYTIYVGKAESAEEAAKVQAAKKEAAEAKLKMSDTAPTIIGLKTKDGKEAKSDTSYAKYFKIFEYEQGVKLISIDISQDTELHKEYTENAEKAVADSEKEETVEYDDDGNVITKSPNEYTEALYKNNIVNYLLVPEDFEVPAGLDKEYIIVTVPAEKTFMASPEAIKMMEDLKCLDAVSLLGMDEKDVKSETLEKALKDDTVKLAGDLEKPDYQKVVKDKTDLVILPGDVLPEEIKKDAKDKDKLTEEAKEMQKNLEKLESRFTTLDAPVIIDRSAQEKDELAQAEWIKVYGALYGCEEQADKIFDELVKKADKK